MGRIALRETEDNRLRMSFKFDNDDLNFVKTAFTGRQYDGPSQSWLVPATDRNLDKIRANRHRFVEVEAVLRRIQEQRSQRVEASQAFAASEKFTLRTGLQGVLRPYQEAGVEFITQHAKNKAYIGDEMGLGKTITALAAIHQEQAYPALVVCPSVVVGNWKREANTWLPDKKVQVIKTGKDFIDPQADIVVASYALAGKVAKDKRFAQVICDEAHYLKNKDAKRTQEIAAIAQLAPRRLMLSGTPVTNKPKDLFQQLEIIDVTGKGKPLGSFYQFATQYCGGHQGRYGFEADGATHVEELNQRLRDGVYLRRDKAQICSLKAGGVGSTMTAASDVLMVEQDWTPANLDQAEDRAHRMGQKNAVNVTYLVMQGTVDDQLEAVIAYKRKVAADLTVPVKDEVLQAWKERALSKGRGNGR